MSELMQPEPVTIVAAMSNDPRYQGSIHDDASARTFGYKGALVPGPIVYGYLSQIPIKTWLAPWLARGTMRSHSRRPVYQGDTITVSAEPIQITEAGKSMRLAARNDNGDTVATGEATFPTLAAMPPDVADFPVIPGVDPKPFIPVDEFGAGRRFNSDPIVMTQAVLDAHLAEFRESWPGYAAEGIAHSGYLLRRMVRDSVLSYRHETPGIFVTAWIQHFALAKVGDTLTTSGVVTGVYERKGQHYYDSDQVVIANGTKVIAFARRSTIYIVRRAAAAA
jgi:acyl dehydratase